MSFHLLLVSLVCLYRKQSPGGTLDTHSFREARAFIGDSLLLPLFGLQKAEDLYRRRDINIKDQGGSTAERGEGDLNRSGGIKEGS